MKERLIGLIKTYILFVCIFILQKPLFILYYSSLYAGPSWLSGMVYPLTSHLPDI